MNINGRSGFSHIASEEDKRKIYEIHTEWWAANEELDIPQIRCLLPAGDAYHMFNLNGHPYFGIDNVASLWEWLRAHRHQFGKPEMNIVRFEISGDMAYILAEGSSIKNMVGYIDVERGSSKDAAGDPEMRRMFYRSTEIYKRDDNMGNAIWKMWHFHGSYLAGQETPRAPFMDTYAQRGLGSVTAR